MAFARSGRLHLGTQGPNHRPQRKTCLAPFPAQTGALPTPTFGIFSFSALCQSPGGVPAYALTIFAGAFLLFLAQPLIGKYILPWFGGGPGVWTTCMLFFQALLLGGYAYAHFGSRRLKPRAQALLHLVLVAAALALLPIVPGDSWKPRDGAHPALHILVLLAASLGLPYFVLASTSPLLQQWLTRTHPGKPPYRLYALSNAGSLLALAAILFYFEMHFTRHTQANLWGWGLAAYAVGCAFCAAKLWKAEDAGPPASRSRPLPGEGWRTDSGTVNARPLLWLLLPACASVLLLATTNKMCLDVAVIPFLWVLPLGLYLLSFILCFDSARWYVRFPFTLALAGALGGLCWALLHGSGPRCPGRSRSIAARCSSARWFATANSTVFVPPPSRLTEFYLMIAAGGAVGALFVAVGSPMLFTASTNCTAAFCCAACSFSSPAPGTGGAPARQVSHRKSNCSTCRSSGSWPRPCGPMPGRGSPAPCCCWLLADWTGSSHGLPLTQVPVPERFPSSCAPVCGPCLARWQSCGSRARIPGLSPLASAGLHRAGNRLAGAGRDALAVRMPAPRRSRAHLEGLLRHADGL